MQCQRVKERPQKKQFPFVISVSPEAWTFSCCCCYCCVYAVVITMLLLYVNAATLAIAVVVAAAAVDLYIVRSSLNIARAYFHLVIDSLNYLTQSGVAHMMRRARSVPTFFPEIINTKKFLMQLVPLLIYGWKMAHKSDLFTFLGGNFHFLHISSFSRCSTKGRWILSYCTLY